MSSEVNLHVDQGSDYAISLTLKDANGDGLNLSGYSVRGQFKKNYGSSVKHDLTVTIVDETNGIVDVTLTGNASSNVAYGRYVYDIERYNVSENKRILQGLLILNPEV